MKIKHIAASCLAFAILIPACSEDDPKPTNVDSGVDSGTDAVEDDAATEDTQQPDVQKDTQNDTDKPDSPMGPCNPNEGLNVDDNPTCKVAETDFDSTNTDTDGWSECISDDGTYHRIDPSISSIARVAAFDKIATLLAFDGSKIPTIEDFIEARKEYSIAEGLSSRVDRREDEHYAALEEACRDLTPEEQQANADRCVGPAKIQPIITNALSEGSKGNDLEANAARVEAGLLWFLYVSVHKEAFTCTKTKKDCDSSYAYYTGGEDDKAKGKGLSSYVLARSPQAHNRVWEGLLAMRCWRDLDKDDTATDIKMRDKALKQLDTALLRGVAVIVGQRLANKNCVKAWETITILGPVLLREANERDAAKATQLAEQFAKPSADQLDVETTKTLLDEIFPCP